VIHTLLIEILRPNDHWIRVNELRASDPPGSISDNRPNGDRHVIVFGCLGETSVIIRMTRGQDFEAGSFRLVENNSDGKTLAILTEEQSFECTVHTDTSPQPRTVRFTHRVQS
jgi:hypothetical protein